MPIDFSDFCRYGAWKLPSGKYLCFSNTVSSATATNDHCVQEGFDHLYEPRTLEDHQFTAKLEKSETFHCT